MIRSGRLSVRESGPWTIVVCIDCCRNRQTYIGNWEPHALRIPNLPATINHALLGLSDMPNRTLWFGNTENYKGLIANLQ